MPTGCAAMHVCVFLWCTDVLVYMYVCMYVLLCLNGTAWHLPTQVYTPETPCRVPFPPNDSDDDNTVYDYRFVKEGTGAWRLWDDFVNADQFPSDASFSSIIVPTKDTTRYTYLMDLLVKYVWCVWCVRACVVCV